MQRIEEIQTEELLDAEGNVIPPADIIEGDAIDLDAAESTESDVEIDGQSDVESDEQD